MQDPLAQRILDCIYLDTEVRRKHKDAVSDWILDSVAQSGTLDSIALVKYLATAQPHLLERLKTNVRIQDDLALTVLMVD
jgi:hypothetical protein